MHNWPRPQRQLTEPPGASHSPTGAPLPPPPARPSARPKRDIRVAREIVEPDHDPDTVKAAMRRLLCFLMGHKPGKPTVVMGLEVRTCTRCGRAI